MGDKGPVPLWDSVRKAETIQRHVTCLDDRCLILEKLETYCFHYHVQILPLSLCLFWDLPSVVNRSEREASHSLPTPAEVTTTLLRMTLQLQAARFRQR